MLLRTFKREPFRQKSLGKLLSFTKVDHRKILDEKLLNFDKVETFDQMLNEFSSVLKANTVHTVVRQKFRKPFMNIKIYNLMQIRQNYEKLLIRFPTSELVQARVKFYRNWVVRESRKAKRELTTTQLRESLGDGRKTWQILNNLCYNRNTTPNDSCTRLLIDNRPVTGAAEISMAFNRHFVTVAQKIHAKISQKTSKTFMFPSSIRVAFEDYPVTETEISNIIVNLSNSDALDEYGLSNRILKMHKNAFLKPLVRLITDLIKKGVFPEVLKSAIVKPLHKGGDQTDMNNYRPIAIEITLAKVVEAVFI